MVRWYNLPTIFFALFLCACHSVNTYKSSIVPKPKNTIRVVTYNVNHGEIEWHLIAPEQTAQVIRKLDGDLVLLQETTHFWQGFFKKTLSDLYPFQVYKHDSDAGGLALLSKYPIIKKRTYNAKIGWHSAMIFEVHSRFGVMQIVNLHLTPPLISKQNPSFGLGPFFITPKIRKQEIAFYYPYLNPSLPTIIAGDFNESGNGFVSNFLDKHGFLSVHLKNGRSEATWEWSLGLIKLKRKLDHIFYNHFLTQVSAQIVHEGDSDHVPLAVDLKHSL